MPTIPILSTLKDFLDQSSHDHLQITFAELEVCSYKSGQLFNRVQRQQSRITLHKTPHKGLAQMQVLDNLVFSFSFQFHIPNAEEFHNGKMLSLPRPLEHGRLHLDEEKLLLSFRIDAPDPSLRVAVTHVYQGILNLERSCTPHCGQTQ